MKRQPSAIAVIVLSCIPAIWLLGNSLANTVFGGGPPTLVVVVSVDQLAYEYLVRFRQNFDEHGYFRQVERSGYWFSNCHHPHAFTYTAPGHAVLLTGANPCHSGIIDNDWYDRKSGKTMYCVTDSDVTMIGASSDDKPVSPRNLLCDTLGDQLILSSNGKSKVFGVAIKDRASILMVGRAGTAYWMSNAGEWMTCDYYRPDVPGYLRSLNSSIADYAGKTWDRLLPAEKYLHGIQEDSFGEMPVYGVTKDFPHVLASASDKNFIRQLAGSPYGNDATLAAAMAVIVGEDLGQDDHADLLAINFSSNDYVGHSFGPQSLEVEDMTYRTDIALGNFVAAVNDQLQGRSWMMVVTADHGVAPIPELAAKRLKLDAVRNPLGRASSDTGNIEELRAALEKSLRQQLGVTDTDKSLILAATENQVYFDLEHPSLVGENLSVAQKIVCESLLSHPSIAVAVTRDEVRAGASSTPIEMALGRSFHPKRSGEVLFALKPYSMQSTAGTTHGSPWRYDTHVPMLILPQGDVLSSVRKPPFLCDEPVTATSLTPTLARWLSVPAPSAALDPPFPHIFEDR